MACRYILLVGSSAAEARSALLQASNRLRSEGLLERHSCGGATLFASPSTPTFRIPGSGIVIGHVFLNNGTPVDETSALFSSLSPDNAGSTLIEQCWGEYVLIQPGKAGASSLRVIRDPSGGVACVYRTSKEATFVASDISIATRLGLYERRIDWDFIAHFLAYPYVKTERTGLAEIRELLPGSSLRLQGARTVVEQVWSPWAFVAPPHRIKSVDDAAGRLRATVESTVKAWASLDEAALVELSGGLDSSIVAMCLRGTAASVHCATVVPGVPGADERLYAEAVTRQLGVDLQVEFLDVSTASFDDPVPPWAVVPNGGPLQNAVDRIMSCVAIRQQLQSFYSGGGGDTIFGYLGGAAPAADAFREHGSIAALRTIRDLSSMHRCTFWLAAKMTLRKLTASSGQTPRPDGDLLNRSRVPDLADRHPWWEAPVDALPGDRERVDGLAATQVFRDTLPRGMQHWFRLPLLSQPVMETCLSIPSWMWVIGGRNRAVARLAFSHALPAPVLNRMSKGNFLQHNGAVYRRNKEAMRNFLVEGQLQHHGLLDCDAVSAYFQRPLEPRDRSFMRIFDLCRTENWVRHQG